MKNRYRANGYRANGYGSNLGDEIQDIIQDVLNTKNFSRLNQDIGRTVNSALRDFDGLFSSKAGFKEPDILNKPLSKDNGTPFENRSESEFYKPKPKNSKYENSMYKNTAKKMDLSLARNVPGTISGILFTVFGLVGVGVFGITILNFCIALTFSSMAEMSVATIMVPIPFLIISIILACKGAQLRKRTYRFKRYVMKINGRKYCNVDELSKTIGKSDKFVANDIQKMIYLGLFPYGHMDEEKTCLMLDDETYKQYQETKKWAKEQQGETTDSNTNQESEEARQQRVTIEEGKNYIDQIKAANDAILGEEVSKKLDRLEDVTSKIFNHIEKNPDQISEIRKFMNYYLPTTLKLTETYAELDKQTVDGSNISSAKNEIEKTLDTINKAFENLLDGLFYHAAMDISSDISVLETMLAQEGLTENEFNVKNKKEDKN